MLNATRTVAYPARVAEFVTEYSQSFDFVLGGSPYAFTPPHKVFGRSLYGVIIPYTRVHIIKGGMSSQEVSEKSNTGVNINIHTSEDKFEAPLSNRPESSGALLKDMRAPS